MIIRGKYVVFSLVILTIIVGALFVYLGPKTLKTSPGVLHLGIRYSDERSVDFTRYPKGGPNAKLIVMEPNGKIIHKYEMLKLGRNLIPIEQNLYSNYPVVKLLLAADGYNPITFDAMIVGRTVKPITIKNDLLIKNNSKEDPSEIITEGIGSTFKKSMKDYIFSDNLIGARLYRINE